MKITGITLVRLSLPLEPPFLAAWDPEPRRRFPATVALVDTDEGVRGVGSGDSMRHDHNYPIHQAERSLTRALRDYDGACLEGRSRVGYRSHS
jgi:L-alanine-DL-glutamate epimerase-like enolase superfamily enzyme